MTASPGLRGVRAAAPRAHRAGRQGGQELRGAAANYVGSPSCRQEPQTTETYGAISIILRVLFRVPAKMGTVNVFEGGHGWFPGLCPIRT